MKLERLILKDFLSYEEFDYSFESKPLLVQGLNLSDDGQKTNGAGKSAFLTGVEQLIAFTNSRGVNDSELIAYGKKQANLQLFASCDVRKERIHIESTINLKGSNTLIVKIRKYDSENWINAKFSTVPDGKKYVSDWFAISKEDLFNYFIINNTRFKSFFKSSNTEKVALINRFSDASIVQGIENLDLEDLLKEEEEAKVSVNSTSGKIDLLTSSLEKEKNRDFEEELEEEAEAFEKEIDDILEEVNNEKENILSKSKTKPTIKEEISSFKAEIEEIKEERSSIEEEIKKIDSEVESSLKDVSSAKDLLDSFKAVDFKAKKDAFEGDKQTKKSEVRELKNKKSENEESKEKLLKLVKGIEVKLSGTITCPSCSHKFILDGDLKDLEEKRANAENLKAKVDLLINKRKSSINEILENIELIEEEISKINSKQSAQNDKKNKLSSSLNSSTESLNKIKEKLGKKKLALESLDLKESKKLEKIRVSNEKLLKVDSDIEAIKNSIKLKDEKIKLIEQQKQQLKKGDNKKQIKELEKDLLSYTSELALNQKSLLKVKEKLDNKNQWIQNFKQFRMYLANQSLSVIEYHCNRYLREMKSDLVVKIEGFKVLADGAIREEINCSIIRNFERNFSSFSGGEKGRLLFASILANRFMINETHPYGGLDFLGIDEVFEGVDSEGLVSLIDSAKLLSIPVLLITHVSVEEDDNVLTIVKENGVSRIKD